MVCANCHGPHRILSVVGCAGASVAASECTDRLSSSIRFGVVVVVGAAFRGFGVICRRWSAEIPESSYIKCLYPADPLCYNNPSDSVGL